MISWLNRTPNDFPRIVMTIPKSSPSCRGLECNQQRYQHDFSVHSSYSEQNHRSPTTTLKELAKFNTSPNMAPNLQTKPPATKYVVLSYPTPEILLVRLNRPKSLNCINSEGNTELEQLWQWLDAEPSLCVGVITGTGRAFCAGADLKGTTAATTTSSPERILHNRRNTDALQNGTTLTPRTAPVRSVRWVSALCPVVTARNLSLRLLMVSASVEAAR